MVEGLKDTSAARTIISSKLIFARGFAKELAYTKVRLWKEERTAFKEGR